MALAGSVRDREQYARQSLGVARGMKLLRFVRVMLASHKAVAGQSRVYDGDVRAVRLAADEFEAWANREKMR